MRLLNRWVACSAAAGLALVAVAQTPSTAMPDIQPIRTSVVRPSKDIDTTKLFPQVVTTITPGRPTPRNPGRGEPLPKGQGSGSFATGTATLEHALSAKARFPGIGATGYVPPDPHIAVGPEFIVQVVNSSVAFFRKSDGGKMFQQPLGNPGFFVGMQVGSFIFDPKVIYDPKHERFIIVVLDVDFNFGESFFEICVSDDSNPNGVWHRYVVPNTVGGAFWGDYPSVGVNQDYIAVSTNLFAFSSGTPPAPVQVQVLSKAQMLVGGPIVRSDFLLNKFTVQLAKQTVDSTRPIYGVALSTLSQSTAFAIRKVGANPVISQANFGVAPFATPAFGYALASGGGLDAIGGRNMDLVALDNLATYAITVDALTPGQPEKCAVRWVEVNMANWPSAGLPSVRQSGQITYAGDESALMPGVAYSLNGNLMVTGTHCSPIMTPRLFASIRKSDDPLGFLSVPVDMAKSPQVTLPPFVSRWGDYAGAAADPTSPADFWACTELVLDEGFNWSTAIVLVDAGQANAGGVNPTAVVPVLGSVNAGSLASFTTNGDANIYTLGAVPSDRGVYSSYDLTFQVAATNTQTRQLTGLLALGADAANITGYVSMWNFTTSTWTLLATKRLVNGSTVDIDFGVGPSSAQNYVEPGTNQVRVRVTTFQAYRRQGGTPIPHQSNSDYARLNQYTN